MVIDADLEDQPLPAQQRPAKREREVLPGAAASSWEGAGVANSDIVEIPDSPTVQALCHL